MAQTISIILSFHREAAPQFEAMFKAEVYPLWQEFKSEGKFIHASLTPVQDGSESREDIIDYILHLEVPGMAEHSAFDSDPRFLAFLKKAQPMQPEEPKVWFGEPLFQV
jgi:hypothetical protein